MEGLLHVLNRLGKENNELEALYKYKRDRADELEAEIKELKSKLTIQKELTNPPETSQPSGV